MVWIIWNNLSKTVSVPATGLWKWSSKDNMLMSVFSLLIDFTYLGFFSSFFFILTFFLGVENNTVIQRALWKSENLPNEKTSI